MRNKRIFLFNEEKEAAYIYNNGFSGSALDYTKMYLIAKYIRKITNYGEIRLEKELIRFSKQHDKNFNPILEAKNIKKWVKSALEYNLRDIPHVSISKKEISKLNAIKNNRDRKILFSILIFAKALKKGNVKKKKRDTKPSPFYYIHYNNFPDIIRISKLNNISEIDLADILHNYKHMFTFYNPDRELIRLEYGEKEGNIIIGDLNNIMKYYDILFEEHKIIGYCERCNKEITKNNNKQKYCKDCARIISNEKHKNIMRKKRSVTK